MGWRSRCVWNKFTVIRKLRTNNVYVDASCTAVGIRYHGTCLVGNNTVTWENSIKIIVLCNTDTNLDNKHFPSPRTPNQFTANRRRRRFIEQKVNVGIRGTDRFIAHFSPESHPLLSSVLTNVEKPATESRTTGSRKDLVKRDSDH